MRAAITVEYLTGTDNGFAEVLRVACNGVEMFSEVSYLNRGLPGGKWTAKLYPVISDKGSVIGLSCVCGDETYPCVIKLKKASTFGHSTYGVWAIVRGIYMKGTLYTGLFGKNGWAFLSECEVGDIPRDYATRLCLSDSAKKMQEMCKSHEKGEVK